MDPATKRLTLNQRGPLALSQLSFLQGTTVHLQFAIFEEGSTTELVTDFSNLEDVQCEVRLGRSGGGPIIMTADSIDPDDLASINISQWNAGTHQHGTFTLTSTMMDQYVPASVLECWLSIFSTTTDGGRISHGVAPFQIYRNRASGISVPEGDDVLTWTLYTAPDGANYAKGTSGSGSIGYVPLLTSVP